MSARIVTVNPTAAKGGRLRRRVRRGPLRAEGLPAAAAGRSSGYLWHLDRITPRLYRLTDLAGRDAVIVVQGQKVVDRLWSLVLPATCNAGGAGHWRSTHAEHLKVAGVRSLVVVPDADDAARRHGQAVVRVCAPAGLRAPSAALPHGPKDICAYAAR